MSEDQTVCEHDALGHGWHRKDRVSCQEWDEACEIAEVNGVVIRRNGYGWSDLGSAATMAEANGWGPEPYIAPTFRPDANSNITLQAESAQEFTATYDRNLMAHAPAGHIGTDIETVEARRIRSDYRTIQNLERENRLWRRTTILVSLMGSASWALALISHFGGA